MALTVKELIVELSKLNPKHASSYIIVYHSDSDIDFSISGVEMNYDTNKEGDVLISIEDA